MTTNDKDSSPHLDLFFGINSNTFERNHSFTFIENSFIIIKNKKFMVAA